MAKGNAKGSLHRHGSKPVDLGPAAGERVYVKADKALGREHGIGEIEQKLDDETFDVRLEGNLLRLARKEIERLY